MKTLISTALVFVISMSLAIPSQACSSLLVTRGASQDGSTMITYTCDGEFHPILDYQPAADYEIGDSLEIRDWRGNTYGSIAQVPHTYAVVGMMNEHQLAIGETTFDGREELYNPNGMLSYWDLIDLALQRARTAREAITVMTDLVAEYGYRSTGESFSIADANEVWIMEMIGPGEDGQGAQWIALRVPDGYIAAHANKARIGTFPMDDPENCLYADNVIEFAVANGYYDPKSGEPFSFCEAYCPADPKNLKFCESRVWSFFRRAAPSLDLSPDYHRAVKGAERYPLWIKPDEKLAVSDVFALMRDHYEGTDFDLTQGIDAGPYNCPYRWRPLTWTVDSVEYGWERAISTQQTAYSFVSQSRSWMINAVGGVYWYGVDDTWTTCYTPLYCGINAVPRSYTVGSGREFSWESAWWVFNLAANYANLKYSFMMPEIEALQSEIESNYVRLQPAVEKQALALAETDPALVTPFLTDYSVSHGEQLVERWRQLTKHLITKYNDGYVKDSTGRARDKGYPEGWLRRVLKDRPGHFRLKEREPGVPESRLTD